MRRGSLAPRPDPILLKQLCFSCNGRARARSRMDARTAESPVITEQESWLQRERASGRFYDRLAWVIAGFLVGIMAPELLVPSARGASPAHLLSRH